MDKIERTYHALRILRNKRCIKVIEILRHSYKSMSVTEIRKEHKAKYGEYLAQSETSNFLGFFREYHLVNMEKEGKKSKYSLNRSKLDAIQSELLRMDSILDTRVDKLGTVKKV